MQYNKATFKQWWEFLKLSENYPIICALVSIYRQNASEFPIETLLNELEQNEKFRPIENYMKLLAVYEKFGDVHSNNFEDWWRNYNKPKTVKSKRELDIYKQGKYEREALASRTDNRALFNYVKIWEKIFFFPNLFMPNLLYVNCNRPIKEIQSEISKIIKKIKQQSGKNKREFIKEGDNYLLILRLSREGNSMPDIIKKIGSREERRFVKRRVGSKVTETPDPDTLRSYRRKKQKAELILHNVEEGRFP